MHAVLLQKVYVVQKVHVQIGLTFRMNNLHPVEKPKGQNKNHDNKFYGNINFNEVNLNFHQNLTVPKLTRLSQ